MTDSESYKAARVLLRRIDDHDQAVAHEEGAQRESLNMLDVVYHPGTAVPTLNYVTPRRGAAWVSVNAVEQGLARLAEIGRAPRLLYYEGLMPPIFRQSLENFGLQWAGESPILATTDLGWRAYHSREYMTNRARQHGALARWWYARGEYLAGGIQRQTDTGVIQRMAARAAGGQNLYLTVERQDTLVGISSLRVQEKLRSAEINAFYLAADDADAARALLNGALNSAAEVGCDLVFFAEALDAGAWLKEYPFTPLGSVVAFSARLPNRATPDEYLAHPLHP